MTYAKEIRGTWFGVAIPVWLRAFDCRAPDEEIAPKAPWGATLWSSERAEVDLGLRTEHDRFGTAPFSCSTYTDTRKADEQELARQVRDMIKRAAEMRAEYHAADANRARKGEGGSCLYQPVAVTLSNFGWSVICDERTMIVRRFSR